MGASIADLRERLRSLMGQRERPRVVEDRVEIEAMFAECAEQSVELGTRDRTEKRRVLRDSDPSEALPKGKAIGKRYCPRCGVHKRLTSFDEGATECRAHDGRRPSRHPASAA